MQADAIRALALLTNPRADAAAVRGALPARPAAWPPLLRIGDRQKLLPAVYCRLEKEGLLGSVPEAAAGALEAASRAAAATNMALLHLAAQITDAARDEDVSVVPLKGLYLLGRHYEIGERPMADLDFLIRASDADRAEAMMRRIGFELLWGNMPPAFLRRYGGELKFQKQVAGAAAVVELQWDLAPSAPLGDVFRVPAEPLWARLLRDADGAARLCPEDHLLVMAFHLAVLHSFSRLLWFSDLHRLISRETLDWPALAARAREARLERVLFYTLKFTRAFYGTRLPDTFLEQLRPQRDALKQASVIRCLTGEGHIPEMGFTRALLTDSRWRLMKAMLFPGLDYLALRYGTSRAGAMLRLATRPARFAWWALTGKM